MLMSDVRSRGAATSQAGPGISHKLILEERERNTLPSFRKQSGGSLVLLMCTSVRCVKLRQDEMKRLLFAIYVR